MHSRVISLLCLAAVIGLSACATLTADKTQTIRIATTPESGASCTVSNGEESWEVENTPAEVTVARAFKTLRVICSKDDTTGGMQSAKAGTRGRAYGNILLLGVPALVDAATGAGYEYPDEIIVPLTGKEQDIKK